MHGRDEKEYIETEEHAATYTIEPTVGAIERSELHAGGRLDDRIRQRVEEERAVGAITRAQLFADQQTAERVRCLVSAKVPQPVQGLAPGDREDAVGAVADKDGLLTGT